MVFCLFVPMDANAMQILIYLKQKTSILSTATRAIPLGESSFTFLSQFNHLQRPNAYKNILSLIRT